jgi:hypothetical protein
MKLIGSSTVSTDTQHGFIFFSFFSSLYIIICMLKGQCQVFLIFYKIFTVQGAAAVKTTPVQLKFLACLSENFTAYSPYALNELNLALTQ